MTQIQYHPNYAWLDERGNIKIRFVYNPKLIVQIKTLPNRSWNPGKKVWRCSLSVDAVQSLLEWGFELCDHLKDFVLNAKQELKLKEVKVPGLKKILYPFQKLGVDFIDKHGGRALVADEMGLGKTVQALAYLQLHRNFRPAIVVCPASLKLNWRKEIREWLPSPNSMIIDGRETGTDFTRKQTLEKYDILIINYDILDAWCEWLNKQDPKVIIMDEVHFTKNSKAKRTKAAKVLAKKAPHVIGLSGTPIINRPVELFNAINMINPTIFPSWWDYTSRYCGFDTKGAENTEELNSKLTDSIMIRRLKKDVLKDLPAKVRSIIPIELDNLQEYKEAERDLIDWLREKRGEEVAYRASQIEQLARFEVLKQLAVKGKMKSVIAWIKEYLETGEKLVIFCTHKKPIDILMEKFKAISVKVDGSVTSKFKREQAVEDFQTNNRIKLLIGNIKAAGVGLTLTAASATCFIELPWTPAELIQAEDRIHRIGQKADSVNAFYLLTEGTIEDEIMALLNDKQKILDQVLDGKSVEQSSSILSNLMRRYSK